MGTGTDRHSDVILALAGGVGGAKLANGLAQLLSPVELTIAVNIGDDFDYLGLRICPDLDTVTYTLAGINDRKQGWGIAEETWAMMGALQTLGGETWFRLGDRDLATHLQRTAWLRDGERLSEVTARLCRALGVKHPVVPISDQPVPTRVHTDQGELSFQHYFVRLRAEPVLRRLEFIGSEQAALSAPVQAALGRLRAVVICPSNPYLSIAPMLALPGLRAALRATDVPVIAVSPIIGGKAVKGPAAKIMRELAVHASALEVARYYGEMIDALVIDRVDESQAAPIEALGIEPIIADTLMKTDADQLALARLIVDALQARETGGRS